MRSTLINFVRLILFIIALAFIPLAHGSMLVMSLTNAMNQPDTNLVKVFPLDKKVPVNSDGSINTQFGVPLLWYPASNGSMTNWLPTGNWLMTNSFLGIGLVYVSPDNSSNYTAYQHSGFNTFVTQVQVVNTNMSGGGTNASGPYAPTNTPVQFSSVTATNGVTALSLNGAVTQTNTVPTNSFAGPVSLNGGGTTPQLNAGVLIDSGGASFASITNGGTMSVASWLTVGAEQTNAGDIYIGGTYNGSSSIMQGVSYAGGFVATSSGYNGSGSGLTHLPASQLTGLVPQSNLTPRTSDYYLEDFGFSTNNTWEQNATIAQSVLNMCYTNGGGNVNVVTPGIYPCTPRLMVYPQTKVTIGAGVTIAASGTNQGLVMGIPYNPYTGISTSNWVYYAYSLLANTNVVFIYGTNALGQRFVPTLPSYYVGMCFEVFPGTNAFGDVFGPQTGWTTGYYTITGIAGNEVTLAQNVCTAISTNMAGVIGAGMFRDAMYDQAQGANYAINQSANNTYSSTNIEIDGPGTIDMGGANQQWFMQGYFDSYAIWERQTYRFISHDLNIQNAKIYASMIEDAKYADIRNMDFPLTYRDGLHIDGPFVKGSVDLLHGVCSDNLLALGCAYAGPASSYPLDGLPSTAFPGNGASESIFKNITTKNGFNPVRFCGSTNASLSNCKIMGVHGSISQGDAGAGAGASGVAIIDDSGNTGATVNNLDIEDVDITCPDTTNNAAAAVTVSALNSRNVTIKNVTVNGSYEGVNIFATGIAGGVGIQGITIDGVSMNPNIANIGPNNLVAIDTTFNCWNVTLNNINLPATSYPNNNLGTSQWTTNAIDIYTANSSANTAVNLNNVNVADYGISLRQSGSGFIVFNNLNNVTINYALGGSIQDSWGSSSALVYIDLDNVNFNMANGAPWIVNENPSNANPPPVVIGTATYRCGAGNFPNASFFPVGNFRMNGPSLYMVMTNDAPQKNDMILGISTNAANSDVEIFNGVQWQSLTNNPAIALVNGYSNNVAGVGGNANGGGLTNVPSSAFSVTNSLPSSGTNFSILIGAGPIQNPSNNGGNVCFNIISGTEGTVVSHVSGNCQMLWPTNCPTYPNSITPSVVGTNYMVQVTNNATIQFDGSITNLANNQSLTNVWVSFLVR